MAQGFYEILGIDNRSSTEAIHAAYHDQLAELVRRLRAARRQGAWFPHPLVREWQQDAQTRTLHGT